MRNLKPKLGLVKPSINTLYKPGAGGSSLVRMSGSKLQARRLKLWSADPHCASCGIVTSYPSGFELDHIQPLALGGQDVEDNCQILCIWYDDAGDKKGCHVDKTLREQQKLSE